MDPSGQTRGYHKNPAKGLKVGRPKYSHYKQTGREKHTRELGGPILRRDRTAHEKLSVLVAVDCKCIKKHEPEGQRVTADWGTLSPESKRELEKRF